MLKMSIKNTTRTREGWELVKVVHEPTGDTMIIRIEATSPTTIRTVVGGPKSMKIWREPPEGVRALDKPGRKEGKNAHRSDNWGNR